jgi:hypothetical protein
MLGIVSPVHRQYLRHPRQVQWSPLVMWALLLSSRWSRSTSSSPGGTSSLMLLVLLCTSCHGLTRRPEWRHHRLSRQVFCRAGAAGRLLQ